jgi:hypothetical protein
MVGVMCCHRGLVAVLVRLALTSEELFRLRGTCVSDVDARPCEADMLCESSPMSSGDSERRAVSLDADALSQQYSMSASV